MSGAVKLQPTASNRPAPTSASSARRRSRCSGSSRPLAPRRDGSVAGSLSRPDRRATSSTRSASRPTSPRRQCGHADVEPVRGLGDAELQRPQDLGGVGARHGRAEQALGPLRRAAARPPGRGPGPPTSIVPGTRRAPDSSIISFAATACPSIACSGWSCFSKREDASVRRPSRVEVRWMFGPFQVAASISTRVVPARTSERAPPITPAMLVGPSSSQITSISPSSVALDRVEGLDLLALARAAHHEPPAGDEVEVEGVHRLPGQQHHEVGDVDDVVDRPLARPPSGAPSATAARARS